MEDNVGIHKADLTSYNIERLQKELLGAQMALEMLFTKNNSLDDLDLEDGGGSPDDQAEYKRLSTSANLIVTEINKRHTLNELH
jgi:hypothetical protein